MHDLREQVAYGEKERHYRNGEYSSFCRDNYPTHDLGPIAKLIGINRGNRMVSLSSRASKARGINEFAKTKEDLAKMAKRKHRLQETPVVRLSAAVGEVLHRMITVLQTAPVTPLTPMKRTAQMLPIMLM